MDTGVSTVHVVDDDAGSRRSLERLLASEGYRTVAHESTLQLLENAGQLAPGCMLLDLRMPGVDGLELLTRLKKIGPWLPVIILTGQGDVPTAVRAMKEGAVDFIEKPVDPQRLLSAVQAALTDLGGVEMIRSAVEAARRIRTLSPREREVLGALATGRANKVIANDLGISVRTVEVHRARMLVRLGVRSSAEAIRLSALAFLEPAHQTGSAA